MARFRRLNEQRRTAMLADRLATQALDAITANAAGVGTGLIMLLAAGSLRDGSLTVGDFVLFVSYLGFIADFTGALGTVPGPLPADWCRIRAYGRLVGGRAAGRAGGANARSICGGPCPLCRRPRPSATERLSPGGGAGADLSPPTVGARHRTAVDLRLPRGTLTVVTGRVGAGKTTLLRAFLGLLPRGGR